MESHQLAFRNWSSHKNWVLFFGVVVISSLFYSRYVLSIGMFAWIALSFFEVTDERRWRFRFWHRLGGEAPAQKALAAFPLFFLLVTLSLCWSDWSEFGFSRIRLALPFLGLPLAFLHLPPLKKKELDFLWCVLVLCATLSAGYVLFKVFFFTADYNINQGKSLPTPVSHVRYGLLIAISSLTAFNLSYFRSPLFSSKIVRGLFFILFLGLAMFTIYLSVRTGWAALIAGLGILVFHLGYRLGKRREIIVLIAGSLLFFVVSYASFSTVNEKINYTLNDWQQLESGKGWFSSDATRWRSLAVGGQVFLKHPYLGAGAGDIRQEVNSRFEDQYPKSGKKILPHNQYVYWLAAYGLLGFLLCLAIVIQPLGFSKARKNIGHLQVQGILLLSFLVEATWQSSLGVGIYVVFTFLYLSNLTDEYKERDVAKNKK